MAIADKKTYQNNVFNLGGDKPQQFILAADKERPDYFIWMTITDELNICLMCSSFYKHLKDHEIACTGKNFDDPGNFACTLKYEVFKKLLLVGESARLQDYTEALWNRLLELKIVPTSMAVHYMSDTNDNHFITVLRYGDMITINCKTNNVEIK